MLVACPRCKTRYRIGDDKVGADGVKLRCSSCHSVFRVSRPAAVSAAPAAPSAPPAAVVVVAHESAVFCEAVKKVLAPEPFRVICFNDGNDAFIALRNQKPDVALLDVALPGKFGFEICEELKANPATAGTKLILIASVHESSRYKRSPDSLYGADDYIEKHQIPGQLAARIYRLLRKNEQPEPVVPSLGPDLPAGERRQPSPPLDNASEVGVEPDRAAVQPPPAAEVPEGHQKAMRLARIIASDIALYNQAKVEEGVRNGTFFTLLSDQIAEGKALYERRVPEDVRAGTDYLQQAFDNFIQKKKAELASLQERGTGR